MSCSISANICQVTRLPDLEKADLAVTHESVVSGTMSDDRRETFWRVRERDKVLTKDKVLDNAGSAEEAASGKGAVVRARPCFAVVWGQPSVFLCFGFGGSHATQHPTHPVEAAHPNRHPRTIDPTTTYPYPHPQP